MFGCKHKFGKVEDGFQYCEKCGEAASAPIKVCSHNWEVVSTVVDQKMMGTLIIAYIVRCTECGTNERQSVTGY